MTVLVVASSETVAAQIEAKLRAAGEVRLVSGVASQLAVLVEEHRPHVIVLVLPPGRRMRALELLRRHSDGAPVMLLADELGDAWTSRARRAGVRAVMPVDTGGAELTAALGAVARGLIVLHPDLLAAAATLPPSDTDAHRNLTPRELEVVDMIAEGLSNHAIARRLGISRHTVKFHVASVLAKLRASSRTKAVMIAVRRGLVRV